MDTQFRRPKISFTSSTPKNLKEINLSEITMIGSFQSLNQDDESKRTRLDEIEEWYTDVQEMINSKVGGCSKKYDGSAISNIYFKIFGKKGGHKNDKIDEIVKFYKTYTPRANNGGRTTYIITSHANESKSDSESDYNSGVESDSESDYYEL